MCIECIGIRILPKLTLHCKHTDKEIEFLMPRAGETVSLFRIDRTDVLV
jgi:hypothetical protein